MLYSLLETFIKSRPKCRQDRDPIYQKINAWSIQLAVLAKANSKGPQGRGRKGIGGT